MTRRDLTPEQELLLLLARMELDPAHGRRLDELLALPLNWAWILDQGVAMRGAALLHRHLCTPEPRERVPAEARTTLEDATRRLAMKNLQIHGVLRRLLVALEHARIPVILLKGAYLCRWVYGDLSVRPLGDLDLLFREQDRDAALRVMEELGGKVDIALNPELKESDLRHRLAQETGHLAPRYFGSIVRVEPHLHLLESGYHAWFDEELWAEAQVLEWDELRPRALSPDHLLLHLATHLGHHLEYETVCLYWIADVRLLGAAADDAQAQRVEALAERLGVLRELRGVLGLAGVPRWSPFAEHRNQAELFGIGTDRTRQEAGAISLLSGYLRALRRERGVSAKVRFLLCIAFPSRETMAHRHPMAGRFAMLGWYMLDPLIRVGRVMKGFVVYARRRFGH